MKAFSTLQSPSSKLEPHQIAARLNARPCGNRKWIGRCPSHDDRSPSLSIAEGSDGRVLLHCHAGCPFDDVTRALGIVVRQPFRDNARPSWHLLPQRKATADELRAALTIEMQRYRDARRIDGLLRTSEIDQIRNVVAGRFGVELAPVARPLWEGGFGGRERDPAWPMVFARAMNVASIRLIGVPLDFGELRPPRSIMLLAEEISACAMDSLECDARRPACGPAG